MPITEAEREKRRGFLCSSDVPAVMMVDPWSGPYDVYASKVHALDDLESDHLAIGNELEQILVPWAAKQFGLGRVDVDAEYQDGIWMAHCDGIHLGESAVVVEAKSVARPKPEEWGDEGTDQVPDRVILQVHEQMMLADAERAVVPVMGGFWGKPGLSRRLYVIERNEALIQHIRAFGEQWWERHIVAESPPINARPSFDTLKRIPRESGRVVSVSPYVANRWIAQADTARGEYRIADELKADIVASMGGAEVVDFGDSEFVFTYREQTKSTIDVTMLRRKYPEIAKEVTTEVKSRVFRKQKKRYVLKEDHNG